VNEVAGSGREGGQAHVAEQAAAMSGTAHDGFSETGLRECLSAAAARHVWFALLDLWEKA
jgi:hypothetical protein